MSREYSIRRAVLCVNSGNVIALCQVPSGMAEHCQHFASLCINDLLLTVQKPRSDVFRRPLVVHVEIAEKRCCIKSHWCGVLPDEDVMEESYVKVIRK